RGPARRGAPPGRGDDRQDHRAPDRRAGVRAGAGAAGAVGGDRHPAATSQGDEAGAEEGEPLEADPRHAPALHLRRPGEGRPAAGGAAAPEGGARVPGVIGHSRMRRAWLLMLAVGCGSKGPGPAAEPSDVVARVDGKPITLSEVQERINALDPYSKARYSSPEQRKRFLGNLVRFEVLAREAEKRGYDRDPDVQRALKNQMIQVFLRKELDDKLKNEPITDAEVAKYYQDHERDFRQPEQVRVSQILVKDRALADKVAAEARRLPRQDDKGFRALVQQHSLDEDSKALGGDLTFFDRQNTELPRPLVEAAF